MIEQLLELFSSVYSMAIIIAGIMFFLSFLEIDWKKHLKEFFKTEEKPSNHKEEEEKTRAEINKARTKEEKQIDRVAGLF